MKPFYMLLTEEEYKAIANTSGSLKDVYEALKARFSVDDEVDTTRGEWEGKWDYYCSVCRKPFEYRTPHCPHCGIKMNNGSEDLI